jgi:hypothetical protein
MEKQFTFDYIDKLVQTAEHSSSSQVKKLASELTSCLSPEDKIRRSRVEVITSEGSFMTKRARLTADIAEELMTPEDEKEFTMRSRKFEIETRSKMKDYNEKTQLQHIQYRKSCPTATPFEEFHHITRLMVAEMMILTEFLGKSIENDGPIYYQKRTVENMKTILEGFYKNEI